LQDSRAGGCDPEPSRPPFRRHPPRAAGTSIDATANLGTDGAGFAAIGGAALLLWWLSGWHPSMLPSWAPWEFSWAQFSSIWLTVWWYVRGLSLSAPEERPSFVRLISFLAGMLVIYAAVQTRFEYLAEHMFFLTQLQHIGMHHLGPFLIALAWPGAFIKRGMPRWLQRLTEHPAMSSCIGLVQRPVPAAVLFVGLIALWLVPPVHFRAMIDPNLYAIMNWSMVVNGILFWSLVLDPRPAPPARLSYGTRAVLSMFVMFPQILLGAAIAFNPHDLYAFYELCGRIYPALDAHSDQTIGGLIIWIPASMMCVLGFLLVVDAMRRAEELRESGHDAAISATAIQARSWTGR
jgi:putative membrane protein